MLLHRHIFLEAVLLLLSFPVFALNPVKASEEKLTLPTYLLDPPESAPFFERDWSYQRARRSVYPYVLGDNMTRNRENVTYKALYLENEYIKLCVLPEIGGRLFYAIDKTNGYDLFYHQHVIKPANVGMLGAWISGGVEWNVFHHHRATSHLPVDYKIESSPDGSKTIWVGETELRHRMSWAIGITLHPGKSYIEISGRLVNATPDENSMLYWSNVATKVDENYQIIFPTSTDFAAFHTKNYFAHWPVTHETFNGYDYYRNDLDASWWKNHFSSNSMFIHDQKEDFIAGYDHGADAGTILTANHNINKGGKFWLWGPNSMWDTRILTDSDGHYIELMMGAYSDNQPDYSWIAPYEVKEFTQYYWGLSKIDGVKAGNNAAALNFEPKEDGNWYLGVNATERMIGAKVSVNKDGKLLWSRSINISPAAPFEETITLDPVLQPWEMTVTLASPDGKPLLSYTPRQDSSYDKPLPPIVERPKLPKDIENTEECYLVGLRNLQFHNPFIEPEDYFLEVLRRDPGDTRANTKMGYMLRLRGEYDKAAAYLRTAIRRQTHDYTRPEDCEALYNLGLILKAQGKKAEAMDTLYRAVWNYTYNSAANFHLAQIYGGDGSFTEALERLDEAIRYNGAHYSALGFKASILRMQGEKADALKCLDAVLESNPLNAYATYERDLLTGGNSHVALMRDDCESYLELALAYNANGFCDEAVNILQSIDSRKAYPSIKMWLGYLTGDKSKFEEALALPVEFCNPFRLETIPVLEKAKELFPESEKPWYYEGCLLYNKQQEKAAGQWEKALECNPGMDLAWRNLGWYYWLYKKNFTKAAECYAKAVELAPEKALYLEEYDQVLEAGHAPVPKRHAMLKSHHETAVKRYYPLAAEVITGTFAEDYDYCLDLLRNCYFPTREGVANFHYVYVDALLMAGHAKMKEGKYEEAIRLISDAFLYPENHQVFLVDERTPKDAQIYVFLAKAYEKTGDKKKAEQHWRKASEVHVGATEYRFWKGLALKHLGENKAAKEIFRSMVNEGKHSIVDHFVNFYGAEGATGYTVEGLNANAYYTRALGELGLGHKGRAVRHLKKSRDLVPENLWVKYHLENL